MEVKFTVKMEIGEHDFDKIKRRYRKDLNTNIAVFFRTHLKTENKSFIS